ncbi:MAG: helix-turn-helix domain-containing protein [Clostridia bacterium]|nr:helix-turn-helix domain-containing protein [Clostridia bacterium]
MDIGKKIRLLRCRASLTQEQLAEKLAISAQAVSKWENAVTMPDITLLPALSETFGVSIDELFDLTSEQKFRRIENRMDVQDELDPDVFREYEDFLTEQIRAGNNSLEATDLLAHLYHHRMETYARKAGALAQQAIRMAPEKKSCQWLLQKAEGGAPWDWNVENRSKVIDFYKQVIAEDHLEPRTPLPYMYLIDNLIADHRTKEAEEYLRTYASLPAHRPFIIPVYEAAIALAEFREEKADRIMEKALQDFPEEPDLLFEEAQYYARKCDYGKAIEFYEASYAIPCDHPRYTDALESIAMICEILGDYAKAADTWKRILHALRTEWGFSEETVVRDAEKEIERLTKRIPRS